MTRRRAAVSGFPFFRSAIEDGWNRLCTEDVSCFSVKSIDKRGTYEETTSKREADCAKEGIKTNEAFKIAAFVPTAALIAIAEEVNQTNVIAVKKKLKHAMTDGTAMDIRRSVPKMLDLSRDEKEACPTTCPP